MKLAASLLLGSVCLFTSSVALADEDFKASPQDEDGYTVEFRPDFLDGAGLDGSGPLIVVRPPSARTLLIRPRTSFVTELLKTVENL